MRTIQKWATISLVLIIAYSQLSDADVGQAQVGIAHHVRKVRVAVIDTGIDPSLMASDSLCPSGHKDFTKTGLEDRHGHGTHISGIIDQYAKNFILGKHGNGEALEAQKMPGYCQIIIKYYDPLAKNSNNLINTIKSFEWAIEQQVDIINYSGGGTDYSEKERVVVMKALKKGIKVVAAAGNEGFSLDTKKYYPAMYDKRIFIVGNLVKNIVRKPSALRDNNIAASSNYGKAVNTWEIGTHVMSRLPGMRFGPMTGTSQATAVKSGKLVRELLTGK